MKVFGLLSPAGWRSIMRLAAALLGAVLLGLIVGRVTLVLTLFLAFYVGYQWSNLLRVEHWLRLRSTQAPPDLSGAWGELVVLVSRIYRRKQHHKAQVTALLREFRRLTTALPTGAVMLGPENEILWFNPQAASWLALRRKRDFGIRIENLVRQPDFIEYLRTGKPEGGVTVQKGAEAPRWFSFHLIRAGERQLLIVRDVTREQHVEQMRKDFVANASHEMRSPLTVITGYLDALADDGTLDAAWTAPVQEMRRQAERMGAIINDLLELSRLESSERRIEQPVDMGGVLSLLRKEVLTLDERPATINVRLDSEALLLGDEAELHSIAANLVLNAVKYTPRNGAIDCRWWVDDEGAHLSVRDNGIGIAPEHLPRLTERFYRVDAGRARALGGSGLGLSIVKHALQRHDAELQIVSEEGAGSIFTCHFPPERIILREDLALATPASSRV